MLEVKCPEKLEATRKFADSLGPEVREKLEAKLKYLETYRNSTCICTLYFDSAPHSFGFALLGPLKNDQSREHWFSGGLIYYGPKETGVGGPQYSVTVSESDEPRWEVNT